MTNQYCILNRMIVAALFFSFVGCGGGDRTEPAANDGGTPVSVNTDSPEGCFRTFAEAAKKKDFGTFCSCMTESSQDLMAGGMVMMSATYKLMGGPPGMTSGKRADPAKVKAAVAQMEKTLVTHGFGDAPFDSITKQVQKIMATAMQSAGAASSDDAKSTQAKKMADSMTALAAPVEKNQRAFVIEMMTAISSIGDGGPEGPFGQIDGDLKNVEIDGDSAKGTVVTKAGGSEPIGFKKTADGWRVHIDPAEMMGR